jgi:hypothetical protein
VPDQRIELLRRWQAAFNAGEELPLEELFDPGVEFLPLRSATEGSYRGLTGIEAFFEDTEIGGLMDFREGKIVRWKDFGSREKALEAASRES